MREQSLWRRACGMAPSKRAWWRRAGAAAAVVAFATLAVLSLWTAAPADAGGSVACYESAAGALADVLDQPPPAGSVFFHETSCRADDAPFVLTPRQACAVESAARLNPNLQVLVLVAGPSGNASGAATLQALSYPNVQLRRVSLAAYTGGTPLAQWYAAGALAASRWPASHASDLLRFLTLWRFGGTYLDLDVVLIRSLEGLSNFAGAESGADVAAGVLNFAPEGDGHALATACLGDLRARFRGDDWGNNGPGVITRVLKRHCGVRQVRDMTTELCQGFKVLPPHAFYPIPWRQWKLYFDESNSDKTMERFRDSYAIHVWNKFSVAENITVGSKQPYGLIAQKYCPRVYQNCGKVF